jgi:hypothetical protein
MTHLLTILILLITVTSCATKIDPNSKRAFLSDNNRDIVWDQKIFSKSMFGSPYEVDKMFLDDLKTQKEMSKANDILIKSSTSFWILWGSAIGYLAITDKEHRDSGIYYGLLLGSVITSSYFQNQAEDNIIKTIDKYNKKMNYSLFPYVYENDRSRSLALGVNTLF